MMAGTHLMIARHIYSNLNLDEKRIVDYKSFLYGNIKPDLVSTYKLKKHYMDESFEMVSNKIKALSALSDNEINKWPAVSRFSQELGVICHFLCDFFCVPHSERWEFKHSMNKHVKYEKELASFAKTIKLPKERIKVFGYCNFETFIVEAHKVYSETQSYQNDLKFATHVCNSIVDYIVDCIEFNSSVASKLMVKEKRF